MRTTLTQPVGLVAQKGYSGTVRAPWRICFQEKTMSQNLSPAQQEELRSLLLSRRTELLEQMEKCGFVIGTK